MCKVLGIARTTYYYREKETTQGAVEAILEEAVEEVFQQIDELMVHAESRNALIRKISF